MAPPIARPSIAETLKRKALEGSTGTERIQKAPRVDRPGHTQPAGRPVASQHHTPFLFSSTSRKPFLNGAFPSRVTFNQTVPQNNSKVGLGSSSQVPKVVPEVIDLCSDSEDQPTHRPPTAAAPAARNPTHENAHPNIKQEVVTEDALSQSSHSSESTQALSSLSWTSNSTAATEVSASEGQSPAKTTIPSTQPSGLDTTTFEPSSSVDQPTDDSSAGTDESDVESEVEDEVNNLRNRIIAMKQKHNETRIRKMQQHAQRKVEEDRKKQLGAARFEEMAALGRKKAEAEEADRPKQPISMHRLYGDADNINNTSGKMATMDIEQASKIMTSGIKKPPTRLSNSTAGNMASIRARARRDGEALRQKRHEPGQIVDPRMIEKIRAQAQRDSESMRNTTHPILRNVKSEEPKMPDTGTITQGVTPSTTTKDEDDMPIKPITIQPITSKSAQALDHSQITPHDWYLVELRKSGLDWGQIHDMWQEKTGIARHRGWYRYRYRRMHLTYPDLIPLVPNGSKTDHKVEDRSKFETSLGPLSHDKVTDDDWYLVELARSGLSRLEIIKTWHEEGRTPYNETWFMKRYRRMHHTYPEEVPAITNAYKIISAEEKVRLQQKAKSGSKCFNNRPQPGMRPAHPVHIEKDAIAALYTRPTVHEDSGTEEETSIKRPTTGGKTISPAMIAWALERTPEPVIDDELDSEADTVSEPRVIDERDFSHYVYEIQRKTVPFGSENPEATAWVTVSKPYTSRDNVNEMARLEQTIYRGDGGPVGFEKSHDWKDKKTHLYHFEGERKDGSTVFIKVLKRLRNFHEGIAPEDTSGPSWIPRTVYEVYEKRTTITTIQEWNDTTKPSQFEVDHTTTPVPSRPSHSPPMPHTTTSTATKTTTPLFPSTLFIYAPLANEAALSHLFSLYLTLGLLPGKSEKSYDRISFVNALRAEHAQKLDELTRNEELVREELKGREERVIEFTAGDDEEEGGETGDEEIEREEGRERKVTVTRTEVEVWVQEREVEGPRNG